MMMVNFPRKMDSEKGIALIAAVLAVAVLLAIALSFSFNMRLEEKAAVNQMWAVKAKYVAEAGLNRTIAALKTLARNQAYDNLNDAWYYLYGPGMALEKTTSPSFNSVANPGISGSFNIGKLLGTYKLKILDCASMIYLNDGAYLPAGSSRNKRETALTDMLNSVGSSLNVGWISANGNAIATSPLRPYLTKEQVKGIVGSSKYEAIKDYITVHSWVNPNTGRAPVNVNTASKEVLEAVLWPLLSTTFPSTTADTVANDIIFRRQTPPFTTWGDFDTFIDSLVPSTLTSPEANVIKDNSNPNGTKITSPAKEFTTEFSFNSGGYYQIESLGKIERDNEVYAESKIRTIVKIFDIWQQTTRTQFANNVSSRAIAAATRFYDVDYPQAAQLAYLLVETEDEDPPYSYPNFNFSPTGTWLNASTGGFTANPFYISSAAYLYRDDFANPTATARWNFAITDADKFSGSSYDAFAWWKKSSSSPQLSRINSTVTYQRRIGTGTPTDLKTVNQNLVGGDSWYPLTSSPLVFPLGTTASSFISIKATTAALKLYSIADAMLLTAVNAAGELYAGTMTAQDPNLALAPGENIQLGTIAWTGYLSPLNNTDITFDVDTTVPNWPTLALGKGANTNPSGNPLGGMGTAIWYRAYFSRDAGLASPTKAPILDDVTITYLPATKILYYREVTQ